MDKLKRYKKFINEKLGIPSGNIESANRLYFSILEFLKKSSDVELIEKHFGVYKIYGESYPIKEVINVDIKVGDLKLNKIALNIEVHKATSENILQVMGFSITSENKVIDNKKVRYSVKSDQYNELNIKFASSKGKTISDIIKDMVDNKHVYISGFSHEIKHLYDFHIMSDELFPDLVDYGLTKLRFGIKSLDDFLFDTYYTHKRENKVRVSEFGSLIISNNITKDSFKEFLENSEIFKRLKSQKNLTFDGLKKKLLTDIDKIKSILKESGVVVDDSTDIELINYFLKSFYEFITDKSINFLHDIFGAKSYEIMFGDTEYRKELVNILKNRRYADYEHFYKHWINKINKSSKNIIKKLGKLYDIAK